MPSRINAKTNKQNHIISKGTIIIINNNNNNNDISAEIMYAIKKYSEIFKVLRGRNSNILFYGL